MTWNPEEMIRVAREKLRKHKLCTIAARLRGVPGVLIENKEVLLTVHDRRVPRRAREVIFRVVDGFLREHPTWVVGTLGKQLVELRLRGLPNKGDAVRRIQARLPATTLAMYFGDDETDEDGFRAIGRRGITVRVGASNDVSAARYRVASTRDVWTAILRLRGLLAGCTAGDEKRKGVANISLQDLEWSGRHLQGRMTWRSSWRMKYAVQGLLA